MNALKQQEEPVLLLNKEFVRGTLSKSAWRVIKFKRKLLNKDPYCYVCGEEFETEKDITIEHIIPREIAGQRKNHKSNLALSHYECNNKRIHSLQQCFKAAKRYLAMARGNALAEWGKNGHMQLVTLWYQIKKDGSMSYNHLEFGHNIEDKPQPKHPGQKWWSDVEWIKKLGVIKPDTIKVLKSKKPK